MNQGRSEKQTYFFFLSKENEIGQEKVPVMFRKSECLTAIFICEIEKGVK